MKTSGTLFVISGPSGSGKTTLAAALLKDRSLRGKLARSVSVTTRPKRPAERQGKDYFFVTPAEFRRRLKAKKILEWTRYLGYYYGTDRDFVDGQLGRTPGLLLCLDVKGARSIRRMYPRNSVLLFILPPSHAELKRRICGRCKEIKAEELAARLGRAHEEMKLACRFDYNILNRDFNAAVRKLKAIIAKELKQED